MTAPHHEIASYAERLEKILRNELGIEPPEKFPSRFLFHASRLGPIEHEELGSCVLFECFIEIKRGRKPDPKEVLRILDRVRHRIVRACEMQVSGVALEPLARDESKAPEIRDLIEKFSRSLSPEQLAMFELRQAGNTQSQIARKTGVDIATVSRHLSQMKKDLARLDSQGETR